MSFFIRNVVLIHVALVACVTAWVFGGTRGELLPYFLPWLWTFLFEGMLCFPQRDDDESLIMARERVWEDLRADPLTWVSLAFLVVLVVPFFNKGLCPVCDYPEIVFGADPAPPLPYAPFCVNRSHHLNVVMWFVPAMTCMLAVKHALVRSGKRRLVEILVWNGAALAVLGIVQMATGARGPLWSDPGQSKAFFFSVFGYANMAADYFAALFVLSLALWRRRCDEALFERGADGEKVGVVRALRDEFWHRHYLLIASALLLFAAYNTRSRSGIMLATAGGVAVLVHAGIVALARMEPLRRLKAGAVVLAAVAAVSVAAWVAMPAEVRREIGGTSTVEVLNRLTGRSEYHTRVAAEIVGEHPLFGVGGWGYKHFSLQKTPKNIADQFRYWWSTGGINVHNDYLQFMAEHGIVGFGLIMAMWVLLLLHPLRVWWAMGRSVRFAQVKGLPWPREFFVFPCPAFATLVAVGVTALHAFGDCPMRSPAILFLFFIELAAIDGFLPPARLVPKQEY